MNDEWTEPNVDSITEACRIFDSESALAEDALIELLAKFPRNVDPKHVLIKVIALNSLYSTQIPLYSQRVPNIWNVVDHIIACDIDNEVCKGSPTIVDKIAKVPREGGEDRNYFSFATKYCSWHNPAKYPIWDSHVDEYLWYLRKQDRLRPYHRSAFDYPEFLRIVTEFRDKFELGATSFKEIDKFLYLEGRKLLEVKEGSRPKPQTPA